jgi:hypothetical protein
VSCGDFNDISNAGILRKIKNKIINIALARRRYLGLFGLISLTYFEMRTISPTIIPKNIGINIIRRKVSIIAY